MIPNSSLKTVALVLLLIIGADSTAAPSNVIEEDIKVNTDQYGLDKELVSSKPQATVDTRSDEDKLIDDEVRRRATGGMLPTDVVRERGNIEDLMKSKTELLSPIIPNQNVRTIDLSPTAAPIVIRTRENFNTILSFVDSVGNPWPVSWSLPGNSAYEEIKNQSTDESSTQHIIVLKALKKYEVTNYTVALKGLDDPIVFILENNYKGITDFKLVFKVPKVGPNTDVENMARSNGAARMQQIEDISINDLDRFYSNEPKGAQIVPTSQPEIATVWFYKNQFVVKSRFELVAGFKNIAYGAGGWRVYVLNKPEYELMFVTDTGVVRVGMPVDVIHNFSTQVGG